MKRRPLILITPSTEKRGVEFGDVSLSLSEKYDRAVTDSGGLPMILPSATSTQVVAECVRRSDGVLLTGGDDINPDLYCEDVPGKLRRTVGPLDRERDLRELLVINEVFRQRKPLLAVCRGHQLLNVALGGTLLVDIRSQKPEALNHVRMDRKGDVVHEVQLTPGSLLAKMTQSRTLGVNSTHHQAVDLLADALEVAAVSRDGVVESVQLRAETAQQLPFLLGVQFHPERLQDRHQEHRMIFRRFVQACAASRVKKL